MGRLAPPFLAINRGLVRAKISSSSRNSKLSSSREKERCEAKLHKCWK
jgi:hypothetical protein